MTDELLAFYAARLDEEETAAKAAADCDGYLAWFDSRVVASGGHTIRTQPGNRTVCRIRREDVIGEWGTLLDPDAAAAHIALYDPARVLREIEAKRAIVALHQPPSAAQVSQYTYPEAGKFCVYDGPGDEWEAQQHPDWFPGALWPCRTARLLVAVYAGHPDYREGWAL